MTRALLYSTLALISVAGCKGDDTDDTDLACGITVVETIPANAAPAAYYRTPIEVKFSKVDETATVKVTSAAGDVAGTSAWRGNTLVFTPSAPLAPSTAYTIDVNYCTGNPQTTFTTSAVGGTIDANSLIGNTYALDLVSGRFVEPEGVGSLLGSFLTQPVLVGVTAVSGTDIEMIGAIGLEGSSPPAQDPCSRTIDFPTADFSGNPYFKVGPKTTSLAVSDFTVEIQDLFVSGAFAPDGSYVDGAVLAGQIDTRPLAPLVNPDAPTDDAVCALAEAIGVFCIPCSDNEPFCLKLYVDSIAAEIVPDTTLVEILEEPVDCPE